MLSVEFHTAGYNNVGVTKDSTRSEPARHHHRSGTTTPWRGDINVAFALISSKRGSHNRRELLLP
jgi:hypothetical protein